MGRSSMHQFMGGCFITGTDTGVGKTVVTAALAHWLRHRCQDVGVMKPVETGWSSAHPEQTDAWRLMTTAQAGDPLTEVCPYRFQAPLSPYNAARAQRSHISVSVLTRHFRGLHARHRLTLVEGAGGVMVPLTRQAMIVDLMAAWHVPAIIVGRAGLGGINQALLTLECLQARRIPVLALVLNRTKPDRSGAARDQVAATCRSLRECAGVPVLGPLPFLCHLGTAWQSGIARLAKGPVIRALGRLILTNGAQRPPQPVSRRLRRRRRKSRPLRRHPPL